MRLRGLVGAAGCVLLASATAVAVVPRQTGGQTGSQAGRRVVADTLTVMPAAKVGKALRVQRGLRFTPNPTPAWKRFTTIAGGSWRVAWDPATGVPSRIWGAGIAVPGAMASPAVAERVARQLLADHLDLLAPGSTASDFELVSNHYDGDQRSIGFVQRTGGRRVVGGQVSFRFKHDRLFVIGSEALPNVTVQQPRARLQPAQLAARATDNLRIELALPTAPVRTLSPGGSPGVDEVVLPLVGDDAVLGYRLATRLEIDGGTEGRYLAYVDPSNGAVLAVHQQNSFATGTVQYRGVDRHPGKPRIDRPAKRAHVVVGGTPQTTTVDGSVSWSSELAETVTTAVVGELVAIVNLSTAGTLATTQLSLSPSGNTIWDATAAEEDDAQVVTYLSVNTVKDFVRANLDANMPKLEEQFTANVNIPQNCNAFYDGKAINFFHATAMCANTGRLEDVVFHEFGHHVHASEIIEGVGSFDGAMSEGAADLLAGFITNDSGMGRGFFFNDEPLRELDPADGSEATWPDDIGEIHKTGIIFGGTFWDLRKTLIEQYGQIAGAARTQKLYLAALRRSVSIPTSMIETLAADDDDGNLANGTPNECAIRDAFGRHGLRTATGTILAPGALQQNALATVVRVDLSGLSDHCNGDGIDSVTLHWKPSFTGVPKAGSAPMEAVNNTRYWAQMPLAVEGDIYYSAKVKFKDGSVLTLADNLADPFYTIYQGTTVPLYCTDFESVDPFSEGWTTGTADAQPSPWEWGAATPGATDPAFAFSGTNILGMKLGGDYGASQYSFVKLPPIDIGHFSDVRLQYRRWLAVEDSEFDKARVIVNNKQAWVNFSAANGNSSSTHHIDREWRFNDVSVSGYTFGHTLDLGWDLNTDEGLQLGGWHIDDVCVVANIHSICGDGVKSSTEQCDDGAANADLPNTCRTYCGVPTCGDGIVDDLEICDPGPNGSSECSAICEPVPDTGGCCSSSGNAQGALALGGLVGVLVLRRRGPRRIDRRRSAA